MERAWAASWLSSATTMHSELRWVLLMLRRWGWRKRLWRRLVSVAGGRGEVEMAGDSLSYLTQSHRDVEAQRIYGPVVPSLPTTPPTPRRWFIDWQLARAPRFAVSRRPPLRGGAAR